MFYMGPRRGQARRRSAEQPLPSPYSETTGHWPMSAREHRTSRSLSVKAEAKSFHNDSLAAALADWRPQPAMSSTFRPEGAPGSAGSSTLQPGQLQSLGATYRSPWEDTREAQRALQARIEDLSSLPAAIRNPARMDSLQFPQIPTATPRNSLPLSPRGTRGFDALAEYLRQASTGPPALPGSTQIPMAPRRNRRYVTHQSVDSDADAESLSPRRSLQRNTRKLSNLSMDTIEAGRTATGDLLSPRSVDDAPSSASTSFGFFVSAPKEAGQAAEPASPTTPLSPARPASTKSQLSPLSNRTTALSETWTALRKPDRRKTMETTGVIGQPSTNADGDARQPSSTRSADRRVTLQPDGFRRSSRNSQREDVSEDPRSKDAPMVRRSSTRRRTTMTTTTGRMQWSFEEMKGSSIPLAAPPVGEMEASMAAAKKKEVDEDLLEAVRRGGSRKATKVMMQAAGEEGDDAAQMLKTKTEAERGSDAFSAPGWDRVNETFERFSSKGGVMEHSAVVHALEHLGFLMSSKNMALKLKEHIGTYDQIGAFDFYNIVKYCAGKHHAQVLEHFKQFDKENTGSIDFTDARDLLNVLGHKMSAQDCATLMKVAGIEVDSRISIENVFEVLACLRDNKGMLIKEEVELAATAFDHWSTTVYDQKKRATQMLSINYLRTALTEVFGMHLARQIAELTVSIDYATHTSKITFQDFLVWVQRTRLAERDMLWELFQEKDEDGGGSIDGEEVDNLLMSLNIMPLRKVINEMMVDVTPDYEESDNIEMSFDQFIKFTHCFRTRFGFTRAETEEVDKVFGRVAARADRRQPEEPFVDSRQVELGRANTYALIRMLRLLGHEPRIEDIYRHIQDMDLTLATEFDKRQTLSLVRQYREAYLNRWRVSFEGKASSGPDGEGKILPQMKLRPFVQSLKCPSDFPQEAMQYASQMGWEQLDFNHAVDCLDHCLLKRGNLLQKQAGFLAHEVRIIQDLFDTRSQGVCGARAKDCLPWLLVQFGVPMEGVSDRKRALRTPAQAHRMAIEAGWSDRDVGLEDGEHITFWVFAHTLRILADYYEEEQMNREIEVMNETKFTPNEVAEFREVFMSRFQAKQGGDKSGASRESSIEREDDLPSMDRQGSWAAARKSMQSLKSVQKSVTRSSTRKGTWVMPAREGTAMADPVGPGGAISQQSALQKISFEDAVDLVQEDEDKKIQAAKELLHNQFQAPRITLEATWEVLASLGLSTENDEHQLRTLGVVLDMPVNKAGEGLEAGLDFASFLRLMRWLVNTKFNEDNPQHSKAMQKLSRKLFQPPTPDFSRRRS